ncbi:MAG: N-acetylmuramidase family protein [Bacteroidales bacterium]|nr:N-acetylmuramidase family protein [Bacteroidales bacterium]
MRRHILTAIAISVCAAACVTQATSQALVETDNMPPDTIRYLDMEREFFVIGGDTVHLRFAQTETPRHGPLTEQDFIEVAKELGVEVAAIKAVVDIEAGRSHRGFWTEGKPILNFDMSIYRQMANRHKINLGKYTKSHPIVFARPNTARYGSQQAAVQARFDQAATIDSVTAIEGTFWGMFQIGGFNWRLCGTSSPQEFYRLMSRSERDQLELFGEFITRSGLLPALRAKKWSAFARGYNGPSYASRGYHRRLAESYQRHKR